MTRTRWPAVAAVAAILTAFIPAPAHARDTTTKTPIKHFVYLMQGDRTFDNYFGTYPGADGLPDDTCQPLSTDAPKKGCVKPFSLHGSVPPPLSAGRLLIEKQYNGGKMDGFVSALQSQGRDGSVTMGHYDRQDLGFSWNAADRYVLFDHFFSAARSGARLNRSHWVAAAPPAGLQGDKVGADGYGDQLTIFDRLQAKGVTWKFYVQNYKPKMTYRTEPSGQAVRVPLLNYPRFLDRPELKKHIVDLDQYYDDLAQGTLPSVAFVASSGASERSARSIPTGQIMIRNMVTRLMTSQFWSSSALMWTYDGGGGWYDHVLPPAGLGFRVPALLVSPYARPGHVHHPKLEYASVLRFIEDNWGLAPLTARDKSAKSIASAFSFKTPPHRARIIPVDPPPAAAHRSLVPVGIIYWFYGVATAFSILLVVLAARPRKVSRAAEHEEELVS